MLSPGFRKLIAPRARALGVIWFAFLTATIIYVALAWIVFGQGGEPAPAPAGEQGLGSSALTGLGMMMVVVPFALAAVLMLILKRPRPGRFFADLHV
jgi:hypothetical protein